MKRNSATAATLDEKKNIVCVFRSLSGWKWHYNVTSASMNRFRNLHSQMPIPYKPIIKNQMPRTTNDKGNHALTNVYQQPSDK